MKAVLRVVVVVSIAALTVATIGLVRTEPSVATPRAASIGSAPTLKTLPHVQPGSTQALTSRSPFASDRSAYVRESGARLEPASQGVDVRLVAISTVDGALQATLLIDGREETVAVGDETMLGRVSEIAEASVTFDGESPRRVTLFD